MPAESRPGHPAGRRDRRVTVVVVSFNTKEHLSECLTSLRDSDLCRAVVVDNGSSDGTIEALDRDFPRIELIRNRENVGYGAAANIGVRATSSEYVLLLNADTRLGAQTIETMTEYLDRTPKAAILGPKLLNVDGTAQRSCFPVPGTLAWLVENDPVGWIAGKIPASRRRMLRFNPPLNGGPVPWVLGAAIMIRREAFDAINGFDESFPMFFEEVDLCVRAAKAGWEVHFEPAARVEHVGGASTSKYRTAMRILHFASAMHFYRLHYSAARYRVWRLIMRSKIGACLVHDAARVAITRDPVASAEIRDDLKAWREILRSDEQSAERRRRQPITATCES